MESDERTWPSYLTDLMLCTMIISFTFNSYYENSGNCNISSSLQNGLKFFIPIFLVAREYTFGPGSHIRYQLPISVPARRTLFEAMIRTRQPDSVITSMLSRNKDEHITLQVSRSSRTVIAYS